MFSVEFLPSSQSILNDLGINLDTLKHSQLSRWQKVQYRAVINWLTKYKPLPNASNLDKVRGCLEAFHHLCELESWEKASKIFALKLNNRQNVELHLQLGTWGYYEEQIELYKTLLGKMESSVDIVCFNGLGKASTLLGNYNQALTYYNQGIVIGTTLKDHQLIADIFNNISANYRFLSDY
ncbi:tetratricopeptide TPR_2 (plasmid) [Nostoc sp. NIES-3756]|uniref:hypothetical protein n=1 Tax=Nostoc sp. NIES-3756 TaxID=1751286 RepID=UPI00072202C4|nr:hypothetical protein [Nostoc sp. NIES-3756]BAT56801.1 tetratricopeptide TPR_2 [Nostoc sp. NIES-3756]